MRLFIGKRAVSPLVATLLLIGFALLLGTVTMNVGKSYIDGLANLAPAEEGAASGMSLKYIGGSLYKCTNFNKFSNKCFTWELAR